jgi:D-alanine transaminase
MAEMNPVFLNGKLLPLEQANVSVLDRGFIFGDGVYELVPVYSRVPFRLDEHLTRLERSLGEAKIRNPYSRAQWRAHVYQLVDAQAFDDQGVYFQVTRGVAKRDHAFPKSPEPTVFMMSNPLLSPPQAQVEKGGAAVSATDNRWLRCDIKSISLIGNCLLRQMSAEAGAVETILFRDGKLTEASASNVFIVKRGVMHSPPKSNLILPGITYDVVSELAHANSLPIEFREVSEAEVRAADEIWVTSSSKEVLAIVELDGKRVGDGRPGPVFRRMHQLYQEFKQKVMRAGKREALQA